MYHQNLKNLSCPRARRVETLRCQLSLNLVFSVRSGIKVPFGNQKVSIYIYMYIHTLTYNRQPMMSWPSIDVPIEERDFSIALDTRPPPATASPAPFGVAEIRL